MATATAAERVTRIGTRGYWIERNSISRDQRYRGMARLSSTDPTSPYYEGTDEYAIVNLPAVREALDTITLEDEGAVVQVPLRDFNGMDGGRDYDYRTGRYKHPNPTALIFSIGNGGSRVRVKAPCGEVRVIKVSTLDQALSRLGF